MHEYEVEALLLETFRRHGSERPAYGSIVGSGAERVVLHYRANNREMEAGELLLIDAGCEYGYYASDVTRTFPVSGTFPREQQAIYELVLEAQVDGIAATRAGRHARRRSTSACVDVITRGLVRLGLLQGEVETAHRDEAYKPFFMHRTSHWLGMDVHDVGALLRRRQAAAARAGHGAHRRAGDLHRARTTTRSRPSGAASACASRTTSSSRTAPVNLTEGIPKTVEELEQACAA